MRKHLPSYPKVPVNCITTIYQRQPLTWPFCGQDLERIPFILIYMCLYVLCLCHSFVLYFDHRNCMRSSLSLSPSIFVVACCKLQLLKRGLCTILTFDVRFRKIYLSFYKKETMWLEWKGSSRFKLNIIHALLMYYYYYLLCIYVKCISNRCKRSVFMYTCTMENSCPLPTLNLEFVHKTC